MKTLKYWCTGIAMLLVSQALYAQQDSIHISGSLKGLKENTVRVSFADDAGQNKFFKATAVNDVFTITVPKQKVPVVARLDVGIKRDLSATVDGKSVGNPAPPLDLFIYNQDIKLSGDALLVQFADVKGDQENNTFNSYKQSVREEERRTYLIYNNLFNAQYHGEKLEATTEKLQEEAGANFKKIRDKKKNFVAQHPEAFASVFLLSRMQNIYTADGYTHAFNGLAPKYKDHPMASGIKSYLKKVSNSLTGSPTINFERKDKEGKLIRLADYKGKTVLLDFWGSWCGPCRASHPHLKALYEQYKKDGFEIIGIAQERGKNLTEAQAAWTKAIAEDGINWTHILNMDGIEKQDLVKDYNVMAFPTKILVGKDGKVLLRITASATDDIDQALAKIYGH
ncbi:TlpA family protein disulfide reductase [Pedobacter ghigonis]|uniref:TlpA family protein disulfide reductase n=1 Tax=Pedobacter ghigonis TaxID=2730403 RepID=UPI00158CD4DF|nr:TlpA disulfide reductase family protein [Pedobacter ghigonis]